MTVEKSPHFGKWRPPLYSFSFRENDDVIVYPVILDATSIDGPPLLPIIPAPKALCHPEYFNLLRFVYSGDPEDIQIKKVDEVCVEAETIDKTQTRGETIISLRLDETFVSDGMLLVELTSRDDKKQLMFVKKKFKIFIPFIFPASSAP